MYRTIRPRPTPIRRAVAVIPVPLAGRPPRLHQPDRDQAVDRALRQASFTGERGCALHLPEADVLLVGLGKAEQVNAEAWRRAAAGAVRAGFAAKVTALHWVAVTAAQVPAIADGCALANFEFTDFRGTASPRDAALDLSLSVDAGRPGFAALRDALVLHDAVAAARRLAATPPNVANPAYLARHCQRLARTHHLKCRVITAAAARKLGMGGLLAVGSGGSSPPVLIRLEWPGSPRPKARDAKPILLVGKAVTFDTGGYSLKPGGGKGMKYDKSGGAAVIGVMQAVAALKLKRRVVALIPAVENMIDADAYRVDDILTFANGVTCEVTNTDAEGRLILADALAHGTKQERPAAVIDLATLTGGVTVALGPWHAGLFCNDDALADQLLTAGERTGEPLWRLPLHEELRTFMKGTHADLLNANDKRWAHPGQGAGFLSHFVGDNAPRQMPTLPWAHLDIAAVADSDGSVGLLSKGPTGFGVRLVVEWLRGG